MGCFPGSYPFLGYSSSAPSRTSTLLGQKNIAKTGALCCVAARPHVAKDGREPRDNSTNSADPYWRTNSSFSPPPSRLWDCRLNSDGLSRHFHGNGDVSHSKGRCSRLGSDRFSSHHHSVSDGALSFEDSPPNIQGSRRWTSPLQKFKDDEVAGSSLRGSRSVASPYSRPPKRFSSAKAAIRSSPSFSSPSPLSEFATCGSTSQQSFRGRHFSGRRAYTSNAVYPMVFDNPVSDREALGDPDATSMGRLTPEISPSYWHESIHKFHRAGLSESQKLETSPELEASSRREGFSWSSASSYDLVGYNGEQQSNSVDHLEVLNAILSPCDHSVPAQKCSICGKFLWQKSPWSSNRILCGNDMPIAGVLPCSHVFHADCLEHVTPKTHIHDPPCPLCKQFVGQPAESSTIRESLQMALKSLRRNRGVTLTDALQARDDVGPSHNKYRSDRKWGRVVAPWKIGGSSLKNPFRRRSLKGTSMNEVSELATEAGSSSSMEPVSGHVL